MNIYDPAHCIVYLHPGRGPDPYVRPFRKDGRAASPAHRVSRHAPSQPRDDSPRSP